jgi:hypothetical protein
MAPLQLIGYWPTGEVELPVDVHVGDWLGEDNKVLAESGLTKLAVQVKRGTAEP